MFQLQNHFHSWNNDRELTTAPRNEREIKKVMNLSMLFFFVVVDVVGGVIKTRIFKCWENYHILIRLLNLSKKLKDNIEISQLTGAVMTYEISS